MDFLQCCGPAGIELVEAFDYQDYFPPQERKEFFNLFKVNMTLAKNYWHLFKDEYLLSLRERQTLIQMEQRQADQKTPQIGDVMLVKEIDLNRGE